MRPPGTSAILKPPGVLPFIDVYNFFRDRLRSIWQDLTVQSVFYHRAAIETLEISLRFLIFAEEYLAEDEQYDDSMFSQMLGVVSDKLFAGYKLRAKAQKTATAQGQQTSPMDELWRQLCFESPSEGEIWCYRLLLTMTSKSKDMTEFMQLVCSIPEHLISTEKRLKYALEAWKSFEDCNTSRYYALMKKAASQKEGLLTACIMSRNLGLLRARTLSMLTTVASKKYRPVMRWEQFVRVFGFQYEALHVAKEFCLEFDIELIYQPRGMMNGISTPSSPDEVPLEASLQKVFRFDPFRKISKKRRCTIIKDAFPNLDCSFQALLDPYFRPDDPSPYPLIRDIEWLKMAAASTSAPCSQTHIQRPLSPPSSTGLEPSAYVNLSESVVDASSLPFISPKNVVFGTKPMPQLSKPVNPTPSLSTNRFPTMPPSNYVASSTPRSSSFGKPLCLDLSISSPPVQSGPLKPFLPLSTPALAPIGDAKPIQSLFGASVTFQPPNSQALSATTSPGTVMASPQRTPPKLDYTSSLSVPKLGTVTLESSNDNVEHLSSTVIVPSTTIVEPPQLTVTSPREDVKDTIESTKEVHVAIGRLWGKISGQPSTDLTLALNKMPAEMKSARKLDSVRSEIPSSWHVLQHQRVPLSLSLAIGVAGNDLQDAIACTARSAVVDGYRHDRSLEDPSITPHNHDLQCSPLDAYAYRHLNGVETRGLFCNDIPEKDAYVYSQDDHSSPNGILIPFADHIQLSMLGLKECPGPVKASDKIKSRNDRHLMLEDIKLATMAARIEDRTMQQAWSLRGFSPGCCDASSPSWHLLLDCGPTSSSANMNSSISTISSHRQAPSHIIILPSPPVNDWLIGSAPISEEDTGDMEEDFGDHLNPNEPLPSPTTSRSFPPDIPKRRDKPRDELTPRQGWSDGPWTSQTAIRSLQTLLSSQRGSPESSSIQELLESSQLARVMRDLWEFWASMEIDTLKGSDCRTYRPVILIGLVLSGLQEESNFADILESSMRRSRLFFFALVRTLLADSPVTDAIASAFLSSDPLQDPLDVRRSVLERFLCWLKECSLPIPIGIDSYAHFPDRSPRIIEPLGWFGTLDGSLEEGEIQKNVKPGSQEYRKEALQRLNRASGNIADELWTNWQLGAATPDGQGRGTETRKRLRDQDEVRAWNTTPPVLLGYEPLWRMRSILASDEAIDSSGTTSRRTLTILPFSERGRSLLTQAAYYNSSTVEKLLRWTADALREVDSSVTRNITQRTSGLRSTQPETETTTASSDAPAFHRAKHTQSALRFLVTEIRSAVERPSLTPSATPSNTLRRPNDASWHRFVSGLSSASKSLFAQLHDRGLSSMVANDRVLSPRSPSDASVVHELRTKEATRLLKEGNGDISLASPLWDVLFG